MTDDTSARSGLDDLRTLIAENIRIIVLVVALAIGLSLALSFTTEAKYDATAKLTFNDTSNDVSLVGVAVAPSQLAAQVAAAGAEQVKRTGVAEGVARTLGTDLPGTDPAAPLEQRRVRFADRLRDATSVSVDPSSNLVSVTVRWADGADAARFANLVATQTVDLVTGQLKRRYEARADELRERMAGLPLGRPGSVEREARAELQTQISRLVSLSTLASPAQVATRAEEVTDPAVPTPVFSAAIAGVIGLVLGFVIAGVRRSLDRRVRDALELERVLDLPRIGDFPDETLGIRGPLVQDRSDPAKTLVNCARILRKNLAFVNVDGPAELVVVASALEGEGKSTVSASLAVAAALSGDRVLLVDADLRRPVVAERFGCPAAPGLSEFLGGSAAPEDILRPIALPESGDASLTVIPAGDLPPRPADILDSARFRQFVAEVREVYDLVVIDTAPLLPVPDTASIVASADVVVLCCRINKIGREAFLAASERLERLGVEHVGVAATGVTKRRSGLGRSYRKTQSEYYAY